MQAHWTSVSFATFEVQDGVSKMEDISMKRRYLPVIYAWLSLIYTVNSEHAMKTWGGEDKKLTAPLQPGSKTKDKAQDKLRQ